MLRRIIIFSSTLITGIAVLIAAAYFVVVKPYWYNKEDYSAAVEIVINAGTPSQKIVEQLHDKGVVSQPLLFRLLAMQHGHLTRYKAGEYLFEPQLTPQQISEKMVAGDVIRRMVTIPEGWVTTQIIESLSEIPLLTGKITADPEEGALLPETYHYMRGASRDSLVRQMQHSMKTVLQEAWENRRENLPFNTSREALILASIVEKETGIAGERAKIAGVFINRLRKGMKLQSDPTVNYGIFKQTGKSRKRMMRKDLAHISDYNTYIIDGLPPTPICNPGKASINAVMQPEATDALYFVADGMGGHVFAATLEEHNRNVAAYYRWLKQQP